MSDFLRHFQKQQAVQPPREKTTKTECPYCSVQCTMNLHEEKSIKVSRYSVTPNKEDPVTDGRLCVKGLNAHSHAVDDRRLRYPMLRIGGTLSPITWEDALGRIRSEVTEIQRKYGKDAVGVYGGGSLTNEECYLLGKFARVALGTKHIDYNGRFCMSAAAGASNLTFGIDRGLTNPLSEVPLAKCIILAGTNIAECQPTIMQTFRKARQEGCKIIVIDPRETATCSIADIHLKVRPGYDAALANGMLKVLLEEGYVDRAFVEERTTGFAELEEHLKKVSLAEVAALCGIPPQLIVEAARIYGAAETGMIFTARGVEQHASGVANVRNFLNMVLLTGKIGKPGCGYGAVTGQANGQGGREHGQKADQLPGYRLIENEEHRAYIAKVWGVPEESLPRKGVSAYEMMESINRGEIKGLIILGSNPIVSNPNAALVEEALKKLDFLLVIDLFESETAKLAHMVLPGSSYLEDEGTMTQLEGRVLVRRAIRPLPGKARLDWKILCDIAEVLGKGEYFRYTKAEEIFQELRIASKGGKADYSGMTYERIEQSHGMFWPCPEEGHPGTPRMFENGFAHEDGRARLAPIEHQNPKEVATRKYPYLLTTGRVLQHYLSGVQTRNTSELNSKYPEPLLEIHPDTAGEIGLVNGGRAKVTSKRGTIRLKVKYSAKIRQDTVFVPFHWGGDQCVNRLTNPALDPVCRMPEFKVCAVSISPN
ncbi:assimilatory nitrate reductase catalytic subunit NasC [Paenibacillus mucilaginosus]|uniref:NasC2 n=3 Tax=Paenibacillus mucilaginosus TaxID=61624 RepID=H6NQH0_9BACL|nr:nitrate reductase [Paenibacillus mucilaginosus]AEI44954.1 NasC2 [Paenibacillus mucilaginosus KNP414]AFC32694.1 NasC2 [Paenibacillus mucilaginosus 3016]AFH65026.1 nitrite reductase [Paenibacillus mucilaginosus K02]MCG7213136.1 nitrate reductase [Paenibacillus mucilaginosus]WDM26462.1 nitrate reductase [Paenibacillus mucilaginosus]